MNPKLPTIPGFDRIGDRRVQTLEAPSSGASKARSGIQDGSFANALESAIDGLDHTQISADQEAAKLAMGGGNLHETALAMEKADVAMRLAMRVRSKVVDTYTEIMRMPV